jgi:exodeoxyribonuclease VII large subunit
VENPITLTELNAQIKEVLQLSFPEQLWVIAEIGELKVNRGGHCYIELIEKKSTSDEITARSRATIWSWQYRFIQPYFETITGQTLQAGLKVMLSVSIEFHEVFGISLNIKDIDPNYTLGDMARKRQETINRLMEEGVFEMNKELELPEIPSRIAIVSSPTAAGYEDFMNQLHNNESGYRFYTHLFAATMQGADAALSIIAALDHIYQRENDFDAVVIIRGGGSQLDLACFDNYELALNITQFPLPVITGIGHEKDESICDMVAHTRMKTPTAVAQFFIGLMDEVAEELSELENNLFQGLEALFNHEQTRLANAFKLFKPVVKSKVDSSTHQLMLLAQKVNPVISKQLDHQQFKLERLTQQTSQLTNQLLKERTNGLLTLTARNNYICKYKTQHEIQLIHEKQHQLALLARKNIETNLKKIELLSRTNELIDPKNILKRGFSITTKNGKAIKNNADLKPGDLLETTLYEGKINVEVR